MVELQNETKTSYIVEYGPSKSLAQELGFKTSLSLNSINQFGLFLE